jgi:hypothetical protein
VKPYRYAVERRPRSLVTKDRTVVNATFYRVKDGDIRENVAERFGISKSQLIFA